MKANQDQVQAHQELSSVVDASLSLVVGLLSRGWYVVHVQIHRVRHNKHGHQDSRRRWKGKERRKGEEMHDTRAGGVGVGSGRDAKG